MAMKNRIFTLVFASALALLSAAVVMAQEQPAAPAQEQAAPAAKKAATHAKAGGMAAAVKPETISGTLSMVDASKKLVIVTVGGVPYDFTVTPGTKITVGGSKAKLDDLSSSTSKQASVTFLAEKRRGNLARSIEITQ